MTAAQKALKDLAAALQRDRWTRGDCKHIETALRNGELIVQGYVSSVAAKRRAVSLARLIGGDVQVVDRLRRRSTSEAGDRELGQAVAERLAAEPIFKEHAIGLAHGAGEDVLHDAGDSPYAIHVSVEDGVVRLDGVVQSLTHMRLAEVLIWWLDACEHVVNALRVEPEEQDNDGEITDAIQMALEKDPSVDMTQLHISTAAGVVAAEGLMASAAQKARVDEDIWSVPGVRDVDDRIRTSG